MTAISEIPHTILSLRSRDELKAPFLIDGIILVLTVILVGFSLVMVYSTTGVISLEKFGDPLYYLKRQSIAAAAGLVLMLACSRIPIKLLQKISPWCFAFATILLLLPLLPGIGDVSGGASRWVNLGVFRFQPGELVKLLFVIFIAGYYSRHEATLERFSKGVVIPLFFVGILAGLYLMQPDFGSTVVVATVALAMGAACGVRLRYVLLLSLVGALALGLLVWISPYRMQRVLNFLAPWKDASGGGYQLIQSLIAVGTGQLTGVGLGDSQQKLFFLPAAHTDFIFAVVAEELGFIGAVSLIVLFLLFLWRGMILARKLSHHSFGYPLAVGLTLLIVLPALLNVGVVIGLLPTKGMVLPLVGYGGSSLITCLMVVGILLALARSANAHVASHSL